MVKRFDPWAFEDQMGQDAIMVESPDGVYVEASSYDQLKAENEELKQLCKQIVGDETEWQENGGSESHAELKSKIVKLKSDLDYLLGFGSTVPQTLLGDMTAVDFAKKVGGTNGLRDVIGLELRCYGEPVSAIAKLVDEQVQEKWKIGKMAENYKSIVSKFIGIMFRKPPYPKHELDELYREACKALEKQE